MVELKIATSARAAFVDITDAVNQAVADTRVAQGLCNLFVPHTTCAVIVSENWDPDVTTDMLNHLERLGPLHGGVSRFVGVWVMRNAGVVVAAVHDNR